MSGPGSKSSPPEVMNPILEHGLQPQPFNELWCQTILQSHNHQNCMALAQQQTHRPVEKNRQPRNKPTHLWSIYGKGSKNIYDGKNSLFNKWFWKNCSYVQKNEIRTFCHTTYKNKVKEDNDLNIRLEIIKLLEENMTEHSLA